MKKNYLYLLLLFTFWSCNNEEQTNTDQSEPPQAVSTVFSDTKPLGLDKVWYQGKAEVSRYSLAQNRYRQINNGEAVLIFVTEDFLTDKQVKNDRYSNPNSTPVIKTNHLRKFPTGFYDYSLMLSVFTPTKVHEFPNTMKVTTSIQDWCGHVFMQLNQKGDQYQAEMRSYFESEGDEELNVPIYPLEDELFNRLRMDPASLPQGKFKMYPGTFFVRLAHKEFRAQDVNAEILNYTGTDFKGDNLKEYKVEYPNQRRTLRIVYQADSPYQIEGWIEDYPSVFDGKIRTTVAKRTHTEWLPYWSKNKLEDQSLRRDFGMTVF